jgi:hypothetical protein
VRQAQELALLHDPSGAKFNVRPVTKREGDGKAVDAESLKTFANEYWERVEKLMPDPSSLFRRDDRPLSTAQRRKLVESVPQPPPPKPVIPNGFAVPKDEENFLALWDLNDDEIVARNDRIKRQKYEARKDLRKKQQAGKFERRAARDEKRKVYRHLKLTWRVIKGMAPRHTDLF